MTTERGHTMALPFDEPEAPPPVPTESADARLQRWREQGWLRPLDLAFARFLREREPALPDSLLIAAALLAQLEGRGHSALPLQGFADEAAALLGWPAEAAPEYAALRALWPDDPARDWPPGAVLQQAPADDRGLTPLVLDGGRLYLRRYWRHETTLAREVLVRVGGEDGDAPVDAGQARALLDAMFGAPAAARGPDWQKLACALALRGRFTIVTGGPGTGKTYTAARLLVLLQALHRGPRPLRIALAAPTGKAASRLRQSIEKAVQPLAAQLGGEWPVAQWAAALPPARTLHALLGARPGTRRYVHDAGRPLDVDLLFVDEASMVHLEMMAALLDALPPAARVVLLGDKDQLASVEAGAVLGDLCAVAGAGAAFDAGTVAWLQAATGQPLPVAADAPPGLAQQVAMLRESRRFEGAIGRLALAVNAGDAAAIARELEAAGGDGDVVLRTGREPQQVLQLALDGRPGANGAGPGGFRGYLAAIAARPADPARFDAWAAEVLARFDDFRVLCALREGPWGVAGLNDAIVRALEEAGLLQRRGEWYEGRPVMVTRNDAALGVFNGDIGIVLKPPVGERLRAYFLDGERLRSVSVARLVDVETAFALTVHKSQGSEFAHVVLALPERDAAVLTRELVYTGITRARRALTIVAPQPRALAAASVRTTRRVGGLRERVGGTRR